MGGIMITAGEFQKWLAIFNIPSGGGGGGSVTQREVQVSSFNAGTASGIDDAFVINLNPPVTSLTNGLLVTLNSASLQNNTTTPTLALNALDPVEIVTFAGAPVPGDIMQEGSYLLMYNADTNQFILLNPSTTPAATFNVQQNAYNYALDAGTANNYIATVVPTPMPTPLSGGFYLYLNIQHANTTASTLTVNSQEASIVTSNGNALTGGELLVGQVALFVYSDGYAAFVLINSSVSTNTPVPASTTPIAVAMQTTYIVTDASTVTFNLPATIAFGQTLSIQGLGAGGWTIQANTGQNIIVGSQTTTTAGSLSSTNANDSINLICTVANTTLSALGGPQGNLTYA